MLGYALLNQPRFTTMSPVLDNLWMFVHVFFAWLAYGSYSVARRGIVLYLLRGRQRFREAPPEQIPALFDACPPSLQVLDDLMYRFVIFGFVAHVVMISSGAIWARDLWGQLLELGPGGDLEPAVGASLRPVDPPATRAALARCAHGVARDREHC